jgi:hypothetical protein
MGEFHNVPVIDSMTPKWIEVIGLGELDPVNGLGYRPSGNSVAFACLLFNCPAQGE